MTCLLLWWNFVFILIKTFKSVCSFRFEQKCSLSLAVCVCSQLLRKSRFEEVLKHISSNFRLEIVIEAKIFYDIVFCSVARQHKTLFYCQQQSMQMHISFSFAFVYENIASLDVAIQKQKWLTDSHQCLWCRGNDSVCKVDPPMHIMS